MMEELEDRKDEMVKLRKKFTLREIGERFGISRERVRQIIGNTGDVKSIKDEERFLPLALENDRLTDADMASKFSLSVKAIRDFRHDHDLLCPVMTPESGDLSVFGLKAILKGLGIDSVATGRRSHHSLVTSGGCRILVRTCSTGRKAPTFSGVSPSWAFQIRKMDGWDFVACHIVPLDEWFIIPRDKVERGYVIFSFPTLRPQLGKYQVFNKRFDLLGGECEH